MKYLALAFLLGAVPAAAQSICQGDCMNATIHVVCYSDGHTFPARTDGCHIDDINVPLPYSDKWTFTANFGYAVSAATPGLSKQECFRQLSWYMNLTTSAGDKLTSVGCTQ